MDSAAPAVDSSSASVKQAGGAEAAALRLAAHAEQCSPLLRRKLLQKGFPSTEVRAAVERLVDEGIVDDARFCERWLRSRLRSKADSPRRLLAALYAKGIPSALARAALKDSLDPETEAALLARFLKKHGDRQNLRFEGFSSDLLE